MKKRFTVGVLVIFLLSLSLIASAVTVPGSTGEEEPKVDPAKVIAKIGDKIFTEGDLSKEIETQGKAMRIGSINDIPKEERAQFRRMVLNNMVEKRLILNAAAEKKLTASEAEVQEELKELKGRFPDEAAFQSALQQQNMKQKDIEDKIRETLTIRKVMENVADTTATITEKQLKEYYDEDTDRFKQEEEVKASHILVKVEKDATPEERAAAKKKIEEIRDKITKGGDFAKLAAEFSDCPSGKRDGGNLDWFGKSRMVPEFEAAAFKLKPGEMSDIVETSFGYHIIKVTDKRAEKMLGYDEVKEDLRQDLINREKGKKFMDWLKGQKEKVTFMNPEDKETN
jgi:peptidyl-prolyl cis-trans isomerase C